MQTTMDIKRPTENKRLRAAQAKTVDTDTVLGSGKVTAILGKGGFATVYEIWNPKLEIERAVKLWHPDISDKSLERFETEIKITAKLHHPNIVEIHNVGEWNGLPYIEMEKINGYCLKEILAETGALPVEVATAICILICRALTYAHRQNYMLYGVQRKGIVHCDIKPANIMITRRGVVKLTDFGLATPTDETLHLETDKVNGSIHYSSPEQLHAVQVDQRTDIYSLGVVMYEMFSGTKAFFGKTLEEIVHKRLNDNYTPFHEVCRDINPVIKKIVKKCMASERDARYATAQELLVDIEKAFYKMTKESPERVINHFFADPKRKVHINKGPIILGMVSAVVVAALIAGGVLVSKGYNIKSIGQSLFNRTEDTVTSFTNDVPVSDSEPSAKSTWSKSNTAADSLETTSDIVPNIDDKRKNTHIIRSPKKEAVKNTIKEPATEKQVQISQPRQVLTDDAFLQQISSAVNRNDRDKASSLFSSYQLEDGEYYFLKAQFLCGAGRWQEALSVTEKGFKLQSKRLTTDQHRTLYMSTKARCLTAAFDITGSREDGDKAMEAWFDVKYILKNMPSNPQYIYADSEIRRINKVLQNVTSN
jgi:serine/threonine protein kinase